MAYRAGSIVVADDKLNIVMERGLRDVDHTPKDNRTRIQRNSMTEMGGGVVASGNVEYSGPFMAKRADDTFIRVESPAEFMGGYTGFAGSICAPDMQILKHVESFDVSFTEGQEKTLCCLVVTWGTNGLSVSWGFYADPWKTCVDTDRLVTSDEANPKTETNPMRDPFISIYPIFRMEGNRIVQIQHGHIVEFNRWWRS